MESGEQQIGVTALGKRFIDGLYTVTIEYSKRNKTEQM